MANFPAVFYLVAIVVTLIAIPVGRQIIRTRNIKRNGVRTRGVIIANREKQNPRSDNQLGGNINTPTIRFTTLDGEEITGVPVVGFTSQHEVRVPSSIDIVYHAKNPKQFYIPGD